MTFIVKNISNSLTYTIASSCVCTSPLAVMSVVGLHDFVKVSISTLLKSFLLIMCIDAPESTTNSLSSGFNVDAGKHLFFRRWEECCSSMLLEFWHIFGQLPRCLAGTLLLPLCPLLRPILKFWSVRATLMMFTWANISERRTVVSNFGVACNSLSEFQTFDWFPHVCALPENRLRRRHVLKYATQLPCIRWLTFRWNLSQFLITPLPWFPRSIVTFIGDRFSFLPITLLQKRHCTFVTIRFGPFRRLFINLTMCVWALLPKPTNHSWSSSTSILEGAMFHKMSYCKFLWGNPCKAIETFYHWDFYLWDFGSSMVFAHSAAWKNSETDLMVNFSHAYSYRGGTVLFPDSWPRRSSQNFHFCSQKFWFRVSCSILLFTIVFNLW